MILVLDASVVIKWFFRDEPELHTQQTLQILSAVASGEVRLIQPPHFLAEVSAVLAREKPSLAQADIADLMDMEWRISESAAVYESAISLAARFDTLYHAVALHAPGALLVTADERYYNKAKEAGGVILLESFSLEGMH